MRLVKALDRHHRVTVVPFQQPGAPEAAGLTIAQCEASAWAISDRGRLAGAAAVNQTLAVIWGSRLPLMIYMLPGIRQVQDTMYAWVARNRGRLPGDKPYCEEYPERCS